LNNITPLNNVLTNTYVTKLNIGLKVHII